MDSLHPFSIERLTSSNPTAPVMAPGVASRAASRPAPISKVESSWQNTTFLKEYWQSYSSLQQLQHPLSTPSTAVNTADVSNVSNTDLLSNGQTVLNAIDKSRLSLLSFNQTSANLMVSNDSQINQRPGNNVHSQTLSNASPQEHQTHSIQNCSTASSALISSSNDDENYSSAFFTPSKFSHSNPANQIQERDIKEQHHKLLSDQQSGGGHFESVSDSDSNHGNCDDDNKGESEQKDSPKKPDDPNGKPQHSYIALISEAILSYPEKKLVLSDIYQYIMDNYPYYNNQERAWRNSIRHNLSLNECFIKAGRAENGKGNYWAIHPACVDDFSKGDYRRRHARRRARGGPYADINVSTLPYNYRCNLGYVPMTPAPAIGYPYHLPYLHSLTQRAASSLFREDITASHISPPMSTSHMSPPISAPKKRDNMYTLPKDTSRQELKPPPSLNAGLPSSSSYQNSKHSGLLPHTYLPNVLSHSFRYSPYGFPFF